MKKSTKEKVINTLESYLSDFHNNNGHPVDKKECNHTRCESIRDLIEEIKNGQT